MKTHTATRHGFSRSIIAASLMATAVPAFAAGIVISQVFGAGSNAGASYNADYVELFNAGNADISLGGLSVQYASATSTGNFGGNPLVALPTVTLLPGQYFLVRQAGGATGATLPTTDATGTVNMSGTAGKVVLVNSPAGLACNGGSTPCSAPQQALILDLVGYGSANFFEGAAAPAPSASNAIFRAGNGCTDSNNNAADFTAAPAAPRNTLTALNACGGAPVNAPIVSACPASLSIDQGIGGSAMLSATDADSIVNAATITSAAVAGIALGSFSAAGADGGTASVALHVAASVAAESYPVSVRFDNNEAQNASCTVNVTVAGTTPIPQIQGSGSTSPLLGQTVTTQGVITKLLNNGFYLQDEVGDGDPATSDGIFVFTSSAPTVAVGNRVRITGTVAEFAPGGAAANYRPVTQITGPSVTLLATGLTIAPTAITLPEAVEGDLERYEGMLVTIDTPLTASQNFFQGRYGQVTLSSDGRLEKPSNRHPAGSAEAASMADENARRRILLDDGTSIQNPNSTPYIGADNTLRAGDTIPGITGVIDYGLATNFTDGLNDYKIHPSVTPVFTRVNQRPVAPPAVGGNVRVGSFNVLNYFTTLDAAGSAGCFPSGTRSDCRGADSAAEFTRQQDKIVRAIAALNADAVGLMEIENNGNAAAQSLVNALNAFVGADSYAVVGLPAGGTGSDAIRVAMIYQPGKLTPVGGAVSDTNPIHNRPPLAQTFAAANGEKFTVVVNHFKSKGSCPPAGDANADQGDGQGCWNVLRTEQSQALRGFVTTLQSSTADSDVIVIGDLNAYGKEDPVLELTGNGYVDQVARFDSFGYSYVFDGEAGYLDHALATPSLSARITGAAHWRINADEPSIIDYNLEFKQPACGTCGPDYYTNTVYRSSDHDPVVIGLNLIKQIGGTSARDTLTGTAGDDVLTGGLGADTLTGLGGADWFVFTSLRDGVDIISDFQPGVDRIVLTQLLQSLGINSAAPIDEGFVTCRTSGADAMIGIDPDASGSAVSRSLVVLKNQSCAVALPGNFVF